MTCDMKISPNYYIHDFLLVPTLDDKIRLFEDRISGWVINIARALADEHNSGLAVLMILSSYFENVAKFRDGDCGNGNSQAFFRRGLDWVFPTQFTAEDAKRIYSELRCGLYHAGITGPKLVFSRTLPEALCCRLEAGETFVLANPKKLVEVLEAHLTAYCDRLRNPAEEDLRSHFELRFNALGGGPGKFVPQFVHSPSGTQRTSALPSSQANSVD